MLILNAGVMSRRSSSRAARLAQATSLGGATQHDLRTFWTSCRLCRLVQSIPSAGTSVNGPWNCQDEFRDLRIEMAAVIGQHLVTATHRAHGGLEYGARGVVEIVAGPQPRLLADH